MDTVITKFEQKYRKQELGHIRSGDTVRVHQTIREGGKKRVQVFEGMVIRVRRVNSLMADITVRRIASGVGVEKTFILHSPNIVKVDVVRRSKVRRNFLSYMRARSGKSTRLSEQEFDKASSGVAEQAEPKKAEPKDSDNQSDRPDESAEKPDGKTEKDNKKAAEEEKAKAKKAKAEEFRKAQEAKN